jgi:hypothetical protein
MVTGRAVFAIVMAHRDRLLNDGPVDTPGVRFEPGALGYCALHWVLLRQGCAGEGELLHQSEQKPRHD